MWIKNVNELNSLGIITSFKSCNIISTRKSHELIHICFATLQALPYKSVLIEVQFLNLSTHVVTVDAVDDKVDCGCCSEITYRYMYIAIYIYIYIYK